RDSCRKEKAARYLGYVAEDVVQQRQRGGVDFHIGPRCRCGFDKHHVIIKARQQKGGGQAGYGVAYDLHSRHAWSLSSNTICALRSKRAVPSRLRWSPKTGQVAKRESPPGTVGWPKVRHGEYTEE